MTGLEGLARGVWVGTIMITMCGCEMLLPKDVPSAGASENGLRITAGVKKRPVMVARACYQSPERFEAMVGRTDDLASPTSGLVSMGNGSLEMGFETADGERIDGVESGGTLMVPGRPGDGYRLILKNVSRSPLELRVRVGGRDLFSGEPKAWDHVGVEIEPGKTMVLEQGWKSTGAAYPLTFASVPGLNAALNFQPGGQVGLIQVGVFALDQEDRMTTAVPEPGWKQEIIPFMPKTSPNQYR